MKNRSKDIAFAIVIFVVAYLAYAQIHQDNNARRHIKEIQTIRMALQDSVSVLKSSTARRDNELRDMIRRDMELIDTLNATLSRLNKSSKDIDHKIKINKKMIDQLWKENN